jgi:surfactin synthase thioesterase subunit
MRISPSASAHKLREAAAMDRVDAHRWLRGSEPGGAVAARLICFPHAGAGALSFARWLPDAPQGLAISRVQLPGREDAAAVPVVESLEEVLPDLAEAIAAQSGDGVPFALYGHSLGATLALRIAHVLALGDDKAPRALLVSGRRAPHLPGRRPGLHELPDDALMEALAEAGSDARIWSRAGWRAWYLPLIRKDLAALARLGAPPGVLPSLPLVAFHASDDPWVSEADTAAWESATRGPFALRRIKGGHFDHHGARVEIMEAALALCTAQEKAVA